MAKFWAMWYHRKTMIMIAKRYASLSVSFPVKILRDLSKGGNEFHVLNSIPTGGFSAL
jgi:hypothetical protein